MNTVPLIPTSRRRPNSAAGSARTRFAALLLGAVVHTVAPAADQTATWNGTTGNWSDFTKWNTNPLFPNNGNGGFTFDAIQNGGTQTVNQAITIEKYNLTAGTNTGAGFALMMNDLFTWTGGVMDGTGAVNANGGVSFAGAGNKDIFGARTLNLGANSTWTAGSIRLGVGGVINNQAGFLFNTNFDGTIALGIGGPATFNNAGTFTKSAGAGTTTVTNVTFNNTGTVNVDSGTLSVNGGGTSTGLFDVDAGTTLQFGGGTHTISGAATVTGAGTVGFSSGATHFNAGTYNVTGTTQINGGTANFNAAASTNLLTLSSGALGGSGALTASGLMTWTGGTINDAGVINANGGVSFAGAGNKDIFGARTLNLGANSTWTAGSIRLGVGGVINNQAGFLFNTNFDGTIALGIGGPATFNNAGTFTKSAGAGTTTVTNVTFNNTGTVNVDSGTLSVNGGGTSTGLFDVDAGTTLQFGGGTHTISGAATVTGAGTVGFSSGATHFNAGTYNVTGTTQINGGTANFNAAASTNLLTLSSGALGGSGALTASGLMTWTGGTINDAGVINANGGVSFAGAGNKDIFSAHTLNLGGNSTWTAGSIRLGVGGVINNKGGFIFNTNFDGTIAFGVGGPATFNNAGTFTKSAGAGTTTVTSSVTFNNTGTVNADSGTLSLSGSVTQHSGTTLTGGTWNVSNGASINITTGSNITTNQGSVTLDGVGSSFARLTTALNNNQGSFALRNNRDLTTAGALANSGNVTVDGTGTTLTVSGGYTQSAGAILLSNGGQIAATSMTLNGGFVQLMDSAIASQPLVLNGAAKMIGSGTSNTWGGSISVSNSDFDITSGATTIGGAISGIGGSVTKKGTGTMTLTGANSFSGTTTVNAGSLELGAGGSLANTSAVTVNSGGTLLLSGGGANQVNNAAGVELDGNGTGTTGNISLGGTSAIDETVGALTLSSSSIIDFGTFGGGQTLRFADSSALSGAWSETLSIYHWSGSPSVGGGPDHLFFGTDATGLAGGQLNQISFYSGGFGSAFLGTGGILSNGEVVPVPEPSSVLAGLALCGIAGWRERRKARGRRRTERLSVTK